MIWKDKSWAFEKKKARPERTGPDLGLVQAQPYWELPRAVTICSPNLRASLMIRPLPAARQSDVAHGVADLTTIQCFAVPVS